MIFSSAMELNQGSDLESHRPPDTPNNEESHWSSDTPGDEEPHWSFDTTKTAVNPESVQPAAPATPPNQVGPISPELSDARYDLVVPVSSLYNLVHPLEDDVFRGPPNGKTTLSPYKLPPMPMADGFEGLGQVHMMPMTAIKNAISQAYLSTPCPIRKSTGRDIGGQVSSSIMESAIPQPLAPVNRASRSVIDSLLTLPVSPPSPSRFPEHYDIFMLFANRSSRLPVAFWTGYARRLRKMRPSQLPAAPVLGSPFRPY